MFALSSAVVFFLILSISSSYLIGVFGSKMGAVDDVASLAILLLPIPVLLLFKSKLKALHNQLFMFMAFFYVLVTFLFLFSSLFSHLYELYKLMTFMIFLPMFMVMRRVTVSEVDNKLLSVASVLLGGNAFIIILQYTVSPYIIHSFGMKISMENIAFAAGRYAGLFSNPNNLGDLALLIYLLNEIVQPERYKLFNLISMMAVLSSSSKHAIVIFLVLFVLQNRAIIKRNFQKFMVGMVFVVFAMGGTYFLNQSAFEAKIKQYVMLFTAEKLSDVRAGYVESRAQKAIEGMKLVDEYFPLGTGLGTWGDASTRLNDDNHLQSPEKMSDSAFVHILVEQGAFLFLYLFVMSLGYLSVIRLQRKYFISLMLLFILASFPTMGMSSGGWPLVFAYIYARLFFSKKLEGKQF